MLSGIGRLLISMIFIVLGVTAIFHWEIAKADLSQALANWELYAGHMEGVDTLFQNLLTIVPLLVVLGIGLQILGGLLVCLSLRVRLGAWLLLLQLIPATAIYYHFWFLEGPPMARSLVLFLKNLSIIGGLLIIIATNSNRSFNAPTRNKSLG